MRTRKASLAAVLFAFAIPALAGTFDVQPPAKPAPQPAQKEEPAPPKIQITVPGAQTQAQAKAMLRKDNHIAQCIIKPVMTDEEIDACKTAYRE